MTNDDLIQKRTDEKYKRINEYRSETQLSIQLGQSVNLALEVVIETFGSAKEERTFDELMNYWTDYFMEFLDKKRKEVFDENNRMFTENPTPTVEQYENMTEVQKKFYKDKQLEGNRAKYAERKGITIEKSLEERVASKQKQGLEIFKEVLEKRSKLNK